MEIRTVLDRVHAAARLPSARFASHDMPETSGEPVLVGNSKPMLEVFHRIGLFADGCHTVLIRGETGTGKELVARAIHAESPRKTWPFPAGSEITMNTAFDETYESSYPDPWTLPMSTPSRSEPIEILLVEDDAGDARRTIDALRAGRMQNRITHVEDGLEAISYLRREGEYENSPRPDLILLDLHMPRLNGREVLAEIKEDPDLRRIPVVMMTASAQEKDVIAAYNLHVNSYVVKPVDVEQFIGAVRSIEHFWFSVVKLPAA